MSTTPHHSHSNSLTHLAHKTFSPKPPTSHSITLIPADDEASSLLLPNSKQSPSMTSAPLTSSVPPNSLTSTVTSTSTSTSSSSTLLPTSSTAAAAPSWFRRRIIIPLFEVLKSGATPEGIALSLAFGLTGGVFPVPTVTTLACIVLAWLFRLNFPAVQITNLLMTPLNLATFIPFIRGGEWLFGVERVELSLAFFRAEPVAAIGVFWKSLLIGCLCWLVFLPCATALLYVILKPIVRRLMAGMKFT